MRALLIGTILGLCAMLLFAVVATGAKLQAFLRKKAAFMFTRKFWFILMIGLLPFYIYEVSGPTYFIDYSTWLDPWVSYIREHGGWHSLADKYSNYSPPYLYILTLISYIPGPPLIPIRLVSILFSIIGGYYIGKIIYLKVKEEWVVPCALFTTLAMPTVWLNGAYWAQCDSIYTAFIIISLYSLLRHREARAWIFIGVAFSLKLQTVFILPLFILLLLRGDSKWWMPILSILSIALLWLPALIIGRPLQDLLSIYGGQMVVCDTAAVTLPNIWSLFSYEIPYQSWQTFIAIAVIIVIGISIFLKTRQREYTNEFIIALAMLVSVGIPLLLPKMHERYLYLGDILAIAYIFYCPKMWPAAFGLQLVSLSAYVYFFAFCSHAEYFSFEYGALLPFAILYIACVAAIGIRFFGREIPAYTKSDKQESLK